jgi:hypothetical protein
VDSLNAEKEAGFSSCCNTANKRNKWVAIESSLHNGILVLQVIIYSY